jgi:hypothetical protein
MLRYIFKLYCVMCEYYSMYVYLLLMVDEVSSVSLCVGYWLWWWAVLFFYIVLVLLSGVFSCNISNMGLWISLCVVHVESCLAYFSRAFKSLPFLSVLIICIVSVMFSIWLEYPELLLLFLMFHMCSLYLVLNDQPVCPLYFNEELMHFIWYAAFLVFVCYGKFS